MGRWKRKAIIIGIAIFLFGIIAYLFFPMTPYSSLKMTDIQEIHIFTAPPEQTVILSQEETAQVVDLLQDMKVYRWGYISDATTGQVVKFTIIKVDRTEIEIITSRNTKISINGTSYRTKYSSTEAG